MEKRLGAKINEGKTKVIYEDLENQQQAIMYFKDILTAGDGVKRDNIFSIGKLTWETNKNIFEYLAKKGIKTHYISSPEENYTVVRIPDKKINVEAVTRRIATGSYLHRSDLPEGYRFKELKHEFFYKDDMLHDPLLDDSFLNVKDPDNIFGRMRETNNQIFLILEEAFAKLGFQLVDFKLEYGIYGSEVLLLDEISAGSFRLWPYAKENPDLTKEIVIDELDKNGMKDKQVYRDGKPLDEVVSAFAYVGELTAKF